jgi:magnesium-transporting ATPase (P-type)
LSADYAKAAVAAIRSPDVSISVDSGTEIAEEAAHVILLEKNLDVIQLFMGS